MATIGTRLVERLKNEAQQLGTRGVRWVVESTASAVKTVDRLQGLLPREQKGTGTKRQPEGADEVMEHQRREPPLYRPPPERKAGSRPAERVRPEARATAERVLEEARAAKERLEKARPAPRPLKVSAGAGEQVPSPKRRTARKTAPAAAPRRVTPPKEGLQSKRDQKHKH